jgi:hypothetical protein
VLVKVMEMYITPNPYRYKISTFEPYTVKIKTCLIEPDQHTYLTNPSQAISV